MIYPASHVPNLPFAEYNAYIRIPPNYGPAWIWIEAAVAGAAGGADLTALTLGFKAAAIAAYAATCIVLVVLLAPPRP